MRALLNQRVRQVIDLSSLLQTCSLSLQGRGDCLVWSEKDVDLRQCAVPTLPERAASSTHTSTSGREHVATSNFLQSARPALPYLILLGADLSFCLQISCRHPQQPFIGERYESDLSDRPVSSSMTKAHIVVAAVLNNTPVSSSRD